MEKLLKKTFNFLDGDFAGVGHAGYWEKGGTASFMNAGGLSQMNKALIEALYLLTKKRPRPAKAGGAVH